MDRQQVEAALRVLIGLPLRHLGRTLDMGEVGFGQLIEVPDEHRGGVRIVPQYALHVQCPFRLRDSSAVLLGADDMYRSRTPSDDDVEFHLGAPGAAWYDKQADELIARHLEGSLVVEAIEGDEVGGVRIVLSLAHALEVFPASSLADEQWRFFEPGANGSHFVVPIER